MILAIQCGVNFASGHLASTGLQKPLARYLYFPGVTIANSKVETEIWALGTRFAIIFRFAGEAKGRTGRVKGRKRPVKGRKRPVKGRKRRVKGRKCPVKGRSRPLDPKLIRH